MMRSYSPPGDTCGNTKTYVQHLTGMTCTNQFSITRALGYGVSKEPQVVPCIMHDYTSGNGIRVRTSLSGRMACPSVPLGILMHVTPIVTSHLGIHFRVAGLLSLDKRVQKAHYVDLNQACPALSFQLPELPSMPLCLHASNCNHSRMSRYVTRSWKSSRSFSLSSEHHLSLLIFLICRSERK